MISINVAVGVGSMVMFAGFMLGYAIGWRQRRAEPVPPALGSYHFSGPIDLEFATLRDGAEARVRRSQQ